MKNIIKNGLKFLILLTAGVSLFYLSIGIKGKLELIEFRKSNEVNINFIKTVNNEYLYQNTIIFPANKMPFYTFSGKIYIKIDKKLMPLEKMKNLYIIIKRIYQNNVYESVLRYPFDTINNSPRDITISGGLPVFVGDNEVSVKVGGAEISSGDISVSAGFGGGKGQVIPIIFLVRSIVFMMICGILLILFRIIYGKIRFNHKTPIAKILFIMAYSLMVIGSYYFFNGIYTSIKFLNAKNNTFNYCGNLSNANKYIYQTDIFTHGEKLAFVSPLWAVMLYVDKSELKFSQAAEEKFSVRILQKCYDYIVHENVYKYPELKIINLEKDYLLLLPEVALYPQMNEVMIKLDGMPSANIKNVKLILTSHVVDKLNYIIFACSMGMLFTSIGVILMLIIKINTIKRN